MFYNEHCSCQTNADVVGLSKSMRWMQTEGENEVAVIRVANACIRSNAFERTRPRALRCARSTHSVSSAEGEEVSDPCSVDPTVIQNSGYVWSPGHSDLSMISSDRPSKR